MFARTSGTTGRPKHGPITPTCRGRDHADQFRTWLHHASTDHPGMYRGKILSLVFPPAEEGRTSCRDSLTGSVQRGHLTATIPLPFVRST
jgi:hypothetical protein